MLFDRTTSRQAACIGLMLVVITLAGVMARATVLSYLMVLCVGTPGLLVLVGALLDYDAHH
jgi:hypothetical protein